MTDVCPKFRNGEVYNLCCLSYTIYENDYGGSNGMEMRYTYIRDQKSIKSFSPNTEGENQLLKIRRRCKNDTKMH